MRTSQSGSRPIVSSASGATACVRSSPGPTMTSVHAVAPSTDSCRPVPCVVSLTARVVPQTASFLLGRLLDRLVALLELGELGEGGVAAEDVAALEELGDVGGGQRREAIEEIAVAAEELAEDVLVEAIDADELVEAARAQGRAEHLL